MKKFLSIFACVCLILLFANTSDTITQAASYDKAYAIKTITVKSAPGTSYKTLGKIKVGTVVNVYGAVAVGKDQDDWSGAEQYGWSKIKYKKKTAWVKTHELSFADPFKWTPGIKDETLKSIQKYYVPKGAKTKIEKSSISESVGFYTYYVINNGEWFPLVTINCKTGWYHG